MTSHRGVLAVAAAVGGALVLQTTLFGRFRLAGIAPDVVLLVLILLTLRLRNETALLVAFAAGLLFDSLSSSAIGLRAVAYTSVVYLAIRTRDRADFSPLAVAGWVGLLTGAGIVFFLIVGTLFSQLAVDGGEAMRRLLLIPLLNFLIALALIPVTVRLLQPARRGL